MKLMFKTNKIEIWFMDGEYWVYGIMNDPRVVPSFEMAKSLVSGYI